MIVINTECDGKKLRSGRSPGPETPSINQSYRR
jgi:hypothetical protein